MIKKYTGWGWTPAKWQGRYIIFLYILFILGLVLTREKDIPGNPDSGSNFLTFALPIIISTVLFVVAVYKKGKKPRGQWGLSKEKE